MSTTWTERAVYLLDGYGISADVENTGGNCQAVTTKHGEYVLAITENGSGLYSRDGWENGDDPLGWNETDGVTLAVFLGMRDFAAISGWRKAV